MKFGDLLRIVGDGPLFETGLLLAGDVDPADIRRQLSRWERLGKVYQLRRGLYALAPPFQKTVPHPFLAANRLAPGSYVSLQSALSHHGMIPEHVPVTTSVTPGRPFRSETPIGVFEFRHMRRDLVSGFRLTPLSGGQEAFVAGPEKALLDLIYLEPGGDSPDYVNELRLQHLDTLDRDILESTARRSGKPKLLRAAARIARLAEAQAVEYETL